MSFCLIFFQKQAKWNLEKNICQKFYYKWNKFYIEFRNYTNCPVVHQKNDSVSGKTCEASPEILFQETFGKNNVICVHYFIIDKIFISNILIIFSLDKIWNIFTYKSKFYSQWKCLSVTVKVSPNLPNCLLTFFFFFSDQ